MGNANLLNGIVFQPPKTEYTAEIPAPVIGLVTKSQKNTFAHYIQAPLPNAKITLLYSHGNGTDIGQMYDYMCLLSKRLNVNALQYEYLGYGLAADEQPCEQYVYECADAAYQYLIEEKKCKPSDIIFYGTSLGSGPTVYLGAKYRNVGGMILETPFLSICQVVTELFIGKLVDMFENYNRIGAVEVPVFVVHGKMDTVVPFSQGQRLYEMAKIQYKGLWIEKADHNNFRQIYGYELYMAELQSFFEYLAKKT